MQKMIALLLLLCSLNVFADQPVNVSDEVIHQELRQTVAVITDAINRGDYDAMLPVLSDNIRATPITQEFINGKQDIVPYFHSWFGKDKFLKKLTISLIPDTKTELSADRTWGLVYGKGIEKYELGDGRYFDIQTRWTAVVAKEDTQWKIRAIHFGTNFTDNPLLDEAKNSIWKSLAGGVAGGLLLGLLLGFFLFRKKVR